MKARNFEYYGLYNDRVDPASAGQWAEAVEYDHGFGCFLECACCGSICHPDHMTVVKGSLRNVCDDHLCGECLSGICTPGVTVTGDDGLLYYSPDG